MRLTREDPLGRIALVAGIREAELAADPEACPRAVRQRRDGAVAGVRAHPASH
jgi:hypothetical protein